MPRWSRWLIFLPVAALSLFSPKAFAEPVQGLNTFYYTIDEVPPIQSDSEYQLCGSELENNINRSYDGEPFENCTGDLFMVHMTGFITIPEHETIEFWLASDDGGEITIGNNTFGLWQDQGCSATMSGNLQLEAGSTPLNLWMYENGGGTCVMLAWKIDDNEWQIVPDEAFTTSPVVSTTTTEESTTTTEESTTSSPVPSSTSIPQVQTTQSPQTTEETPITTSSDLTTTTSSTTPVVIPQEEPEMVYPVPTGTTTTTVQIEETETTLEEPPLEEETEPIIIEDTIAPIISNEDDFVVTTDEPISPSDTLGEPISVPDTDSAPDTTPAEEALAEEPVLTEEEFDSIVSALDSPDITEEEISAIVDELLSANLTTEQATEIASNPEVLAVISGEQASEVFAEVSAEALTEAQAEALIEAVQDAPTEVREAFEEELDVYQGSFDNYVAIGSTIPIGERRILNIVTATLFVMSAPVPVAGKSAKG